MTCCAPRKLALAVIATGTTVRRDRPCEPVDGMIERAADGFELIGLA